MNIGVRSSELGFSQGLLKVGTKQQGQGLVGMSIKGTQESSEIGDLERVGQGEDGIVEGGEHLRGLTRANPGRASSHYP